MIFKVSDDFKGSLVLTSINKVILAGMQISVVGNDLYSPDIKRAVRQEILIPFIEGEYDDLHEVNHQVRIINKTDKSLVLGELILHPKASLMISRDFAESTIIQAAESDELIELKYEKLKKILKKTKPVSKSIKKPKKEQPVKKASEKTTAKIWDLREKEIKEVEMTSHSAENKVELDLEKEKKETKKTTKKKTTKKSKKKGNATNKRTKNIRPVGEEKKQDENVAIELDSRGNPIDKPSKVLEEMINKLSTDGNISFVDKEQEIEKLQKRGIPLEEN